ncbi:hypothetical protein FQR65_LT06870 [Abscondita terminalis]|nr:hypothetical protein FQR65_LT06870 [Abscondita terminalis]
MVLRTILFISFVVSSTALLEVPLKHRISWEGIANPFISECICDIGVDPALARDFFLRGEYSTEPCVYCYIKCVTLKLDMIDAAGKELQIKDTINNRLRIYVNWKKFCKSSSTADVKILQNITLSYTSLVSDSNEISKSVNDLQSLNGQCRQDFEIVSSSHFLNRSSSAASLENFSLDQVETQWTVNPSYNASHSMYSKTRVDPAEETSSREIWKKKGKKYATLFSGSYIRIMSVDKNIKQPSTTPASPLSSQPGVSDKAIFADGCEDIPQRHGMLQETSTLWVQCDSCRRCVHQTYHNLIRGIDCNYDMDFVCIFNISLCCQP